MINHGVDIYDCIYQVSIEQGRLNDGDALHPWSCRKCRSAGCVVCEVVRCACAQYVRSHCTETPDQESTYQVVELVGNLDWRTVTHVVEDDEL